MAKVKKKPHPDDWMLEWEPSEEWKAMQLTPEQSAAARAETQKLIDKAAAEGVYERLLALRGKLNLDLDLEELRKDRD